MPLLLNPKLADLPGYAELKDECEKMMQDEGLDSYTIEVRPATPIEEKALAGEGLAPEPDTGDNFAADTGTLVVYRGEKAQNPLLEGVESDPSAVAARLVDRLEEWVAKA
ncbi:MAG: hypothetical protein ACLFS8_00275 [Clostridia bacterium]